MSKANAKWCQDNYPDAFHDMPEGYQNDNCLFFYKEGNVLKCKPAEGQEEALGTWVATHNPQQGFWTRQFTN